MCGHDTEHVQLATGNARVNTSAFASYEYPQDFLNCVACGHSGRTVKVLDICQRASVVLRTPRDLGGDSFRSVEYTPGIGWATV